MSNFTEHEINEARKFKKFLTVNHNRQPIKIRIEFQDKKFIDNKGFASIEVPLQYGRDLMLKMLNSLKDEIEAL